MAPREYGEEHRKTITMQDIVNEAEESSSNTDEMVALRQTTLQGLKRLLENYMFVNGDCTSSLSVNKFLHSFSSELATHFKSQQPNIMEKFKQLRQKFIFEKIELFKRTTKFEENLKSEIEFMTDPALLLHIFCFLDLSCLVTVRTCCRYFKQCIQSNWTTIIPHLQLQWTCDAVKSDTQWNKIALPIRERYLYTHLCVLAQEDHALFAGLEFSPSIMEDIFDELFYNTIEKFLPYAWLTINFNFIPVSDLEYGVSVSNINSKIVSFQSFQYKTNKQFIIPQFTNAKKIVLFASFANGSSLTEIIEIINSIQNMSNRIVEIYTFDDIVVNETTKVTLKKSFILFLFLSHYTLVLEEDKQTVLPRKQSCKLSHVYSPKYAIHIGNKIVCPVIFNSFIICNFFRGLFQKKNYEQISNTVQQAYANRLFELTALKY